jgi:ABC-type transport system involved in multi-copper enzyme maturation permease subunit
MTFLPIAERELRVLARRSSTVWIRFYAALGIVLVWLLLFTGARNASPAMLGQRLFLAFGILALGFCLLAGIFLTADCLSEEKREGTLGLLFLTDLRGYDVVLGKLMATSVHALYGVLAIFPVLALPLLMGGVTAGEFWRMVLVLLATLLLSLGVGMLSSCLYHESRDAAGVAFLALLVIAGVFPVCWWLVALLSRTASVSLGSLLWPSPAYAFRAAFDFSYRTRIGPHEFWLSTQLIVLLGLGCLVLAAVLLPRVWQEHNRRAPGPSRAAGMAAAQALVGGWGHRERAQLMEAAPFCWLASRKRAGAGHPTFVLGALFALWLLFLLIFASSPRAANGAFIVCLLLGYGLHQVLKYFAAVEATRQVCEDQRSGALELLLVTPLGERYILAGHARAFRERFVPLAVMVGSLNLLLVFTVLFKSGPMRMRGTEAAIFLELFLGGLLMLGLDLKAIETAGFWAALRARRHSRAVLGTLGPVMGVPWAAVFLLVFLMMSGPVAAETPLVIFALWFGIGMITDVVVLGRASVALQRGLRVCLTEAAEHGARAGEAPPSQVLAPRTLAPP